VDISLPVAATISAPSCKSISNPNNKTMGSNGILSIFFASYRHLAIPGKISTNTVANHSAI
jgi:hypothetical protein